MRRLSALVGIFSFGLISASCDDFQAPAVTIPPEASVIVSPAQEQPRRLASLSTDSLWVLIEASDHIAVVGLKAPGVSRGVQKGRVMLNASQRAPAENAVKNAGLVVLDRHATLPSVRARISSIEVLRALRNLPNLDYIEPVIRKGVSYLDLDTGCGRNPYGGGRHVSLAPEFTDIIPVTYNYMRIPEAWRISSGENVSIGLTDTGIFASSTQLNTYMSSGHSANRTYQYFNTSNYSSPYISDSECSHGPRMAGVIAAPRDGVGPIGVAWGADFVSVRHNDDYAVFDVWYAREAIGKAAAYSRIIVLAWGENLGDSDFIADEIQFWHYNFDRLFIGAAGSYPEGVPYELRNNTFFPASMEEVIAVTGADWPQQLSSNVAHGPGVDLAAYVNQPTTGAGSEVLPLRGSSNASGVAAGVAALIWARYPWMTRDQVRDRLLLTASNNPYGDAVRVGDFGYGIINAYRAVGGFWHLSLDGPSCVDGRESTVTLTTLARGDGPFSYAWNSGETTSSITVISPPRGQSADYWVQVTDGLEGHVLAAYLTMTALAVDDPRKSCDP